jgi:hypothetical protein
VIDIARRVVSTTPGGWRLWREPEHPGWTAAVEAAEAPETGALRDLLAWARRDGLQDQPELDRRLAQLGASDPALTHRAGLLSEEIRDSSAHGAFLLAWFGLTAWVLGMAEQGRPIDDTWGIFDERWQVLPHACAAAAMRLDGLHGALELAAQAHETLRVARYRGFGRRDVRPVEAALARYDALARSLATRNEIAVRDLADELCDACRDDAANLRAEVAALLWTLGRVPESRAVARGALTRPLAQRLVRESMRTIPHDPLLQYTWLEMKDRPELALREHEALFAVINNRWNQWWVDDSWPTEETPSQAYARTLIRAMAGDLDQEVGFRFLQTYDMLETMGTPGPPGWVVAFRLRALRMLVGAQLDLYADDSRERLIEYLESQVDVMAGNRVQSWQFPDLPRIGARLAVPLFDLVDLRLGGEPSPEDLRATVEVVERPRAGGLRYWLRTAPPRPSGDRGQDAGALLAAEDDLVEHLRGASFLTMKPALPPQFQWADLDMDLLLSFSENPEAREAFYSPDRARSELEQLETEHDELARQLDTSCGGFTHLPDAISVDELVDVLRAHVAA